MAVRLLSLKCPECGAEIDIREQLPFCFCTYCGAKIMIDDDNQYIIKHIDVAAIKRAETEKYQAETQRMILENEIKRKNQAHELERLRLENERLKLKKEQKQIRANRTPKTIFAISELVLAIAMIIVGVLMATNFEIFPYGIYGYIMIPVGLLIIVLWFVFGQYIDWGKGVRFPDYSTTSYQELGKTLERKGFTNIVYRPVYDVRFGILAKVGDVAAVTIDGSDPMQNRKYRSDSRIQIVYHEKVR